MKKQLRYEYNVLLKSNLKVFLLSDSHGGYFPESLVRNQTFHALVEKVGGLSCFHVTST